MLKVSMKEYEYLKSEVLEIKRSINRYIGYIISVSGISGILIKLIFNYGGTQLTNATAKPISLFICIVTIAIITILFEVLFYKFKSHNRYLGYMQLLSQENFSKELILNDQNYTSKKKYLRERIDGQFSPEAIDHLITWEFVMARYNNVGYKKSTGEMLFSTDRLKFKFSFPNWVELEKVKRLNELDRMFFKTVICEIYSFDKSTMISSSNLKNQNSNNLRRKRRSIFWQALIEFYCGIILLFSFKGNTAQKRLAQVIGTPVDPKYLSFSWGYPRKIIQIGFVCFLGYSLYFFYALIECYSLNSDILQIKLKLLLMLAILAWALIFLRWSLKFVANTTHLAAGKLSIDYYCWVFFIYRIQVLNENKILPEFFCRGFNRYFKSYLILEYWEKRADRIIDNDERMLMDRYLNNLKQGKVFDDITKSYHQRWKNEAYRFFEKKQ